MYYDFFCSEMSSAHASVFVRDRSKSERRTLVLMHITGKSPRKLFDTIDYLLAYILLDPKIIREASFDNNHILVR